MFLRIDSYEVTTTKDLLEAMLQQLALQDDMREVAFDKMMISWAKSVCHWDESNNHCLCGPLISGTLVLIYNKSLDPQWGKISADKWNGPYWVWKQHSEGAYTLEEIYGRLLKFKKVACVVKRLYPRCTVKAEDVKQTSVLLFLIISPDTQSQKKRVVQKLEDLCGGGIQKTMSTSTNMKGQTLQMESLKIKVKKKVPNNEDLIQHRVLSLGSWFLIDEVLMTTTRVICGGCCESWYSKITFFTLRVSPSLILTLGLVTGPAFLGWSPTLLFWVLFW